MAEQPDTPKSIRKRNLSATPPATVTATGKLKDGEEKMTVSPKRIQDLKKRVVEVDEDGSIKKTDENNETGNDPPTSGHDPDKSKMAIQNKNKPPIGQAVGVQAPDKPPKPSQADANNSNEGAVNKPDVGEEGAAADISKRVTRSAVRRGRPRRRGLSMDPPLSREPDDVMQVLLNIQEKMSNAQIEREHFKNATITSIDDKFQDIKHSFHSSVQNIQSDLKTHADFLKSLDVTGNRQDIRVSDIEVRIDELENDLSACKGATDTLVTELNEHISKVETSLASDIESVKSNVELEIAEERQYQLQLENRMGDMASSINSENQRLTQDMDSLKVQFEQLKTLVDEKTNSPIPVEGSLRCSNCSNCSNFSHVSSNASLDPSDVPRADQNRSLIIDGVLFFQNENLVSLCLTFVNEMGVNLEPEDIDKVFRLGKPDRRKV